MKRTNLYLKASQIRQLKALAKESGAPLAAVVRKAIDEYIAKRKAERSDARASGKVGA